jgi:two-component system response regulator
MTPRPILLIEDDPDDVALTLRAIERAGVTNPVNVVRDGGEAWDYLLGRGAFTGRDASQLPGLVLLDLKLPIVNGREFLAQLHADPAYQLLRVVVLTSSREPEDLRDCYLHGAASCLRKPVDFLEFVRLVDQMVTYWLELNESPLDA